MTTVRAVPVDEVLKDEGLQQSMATIWAAAFGEMCTEEGELRRLQRGGYSHAIACWNAAGELVGCALAMPLEPGGHGWGEVLAKDLPRYWDFLFITQVAVREGDRRTGVCGLICAEAKRIAGVSKIHAGLLRPVALNIDRPADDDDAGDGYDDSDPDESDDDDGEDEPPVRQQHKPAAAFSIEKVYEKYGFHVASESEDCATSEFSYGGPGDVDDVTELRMIWWPQGSGLTQLQMHDVYPVRLRGLSRDRFVCTSLAKLWIEAFGTPSTPQAWIDGLAESRHPQGSVVLRLREIDTGEVVGAALVTPNSINSSGDAGAGGWDSYTMSQIAVRADRRGRGLCGMMFDAMFDSAYVDNISETHPGELRPVLVDVPDTGLQGVFERHGFRVATALDMENTRAYAGSAADGLVRMIRWGGDDHDAKGIIPDADY